MVVSVNGCNKTEFVELTRSNLYDRFFENVRKLGNAIPEKLVFEIKSRLEFSKNWIKTDLYRELYKRKSLCQQEFKLSNWTGLVRANLHNSSLFFKAKEPCDVLLRKNIISWNGDYQACGCRDVKHITKIGSILEIPLKNLVRERSLQMDSFMHFCSTCTGQ